MKTILITGASGLLGSRLVKFYAERGEANIIAILGRSENKAIALPKCSKLIVYPCSAMFNMNFGHIDTLIHAAFSRGDHLPGLTHSIEFTEQIIETVNEQNIDSVINISTQGVYKGLKIGEKVDENGLVEPNTAYGLAKWAVENMLKLGCKKKYTNVRLSSLSANARFLQFFVDSVIGRKEILVTAPNQYVSIIDVSDAVAGIAAIEALELDKRMDIYNLGSGVQHSILQYAESVIEIGKLLGFSMASVKVEDKGEDYAICMDCNRLQKQTDWTPKVNKDEMIVNIFAHK